MATINPTTVQLPKRADFSQIVVWGPITSADVCAPFEGSGYPDRSVMFDGDFGVAGAIGLQGSNNDYDGVPITPHYVVLTDPQGNAISKTAVAIEEISEIAYKVKPVVTAGTGYALWCFLFMHRSDGR